MGLAAGPPDSRIGVHWPVAGWRYAGYLGSPNDDARAAAGFATSRRATLNPLLHSFSGYGEGSLLSGLLLTRIGGEIASHCQSRPTSRVVASNFPC